MYDKDEKIALAVVATVVVGAIAFNRYAARKLKKTQARVAMYDRWIETIENLDMAAPTAEDDLEFWTIVVQSEFKNK